MAKEAYDLDGLNDGLEVKDAGDASDDAGAGVIKDTPEEEEEEEEEEEDPKEEDPKEEDPKEEDPKEENPKEEDPKEPAAVDYKPLFEKLKVEDEAELEQIVADYDNVVAEVETLREQVKNKVPEFKSDFQKKAFEFISNGPQSMEAFGTYLQLQTMDLENMEERDLLKEEFVMRKASKLTRAEAEILFEKKYYRDYERDPDDTTPIELKSAAADAREFLAAQKEKYKAAPAQEGGNSTGAVPEVVGAAIEANVSQFSQAVTGVQSLTFKVDDDAKNDFKYILSKDQKEEVNRRMENVLRDPANYDVKTGKLKGGFNPEQSRDAIIRAVYGPQITEELGKHAYAMGYAKRTAEVGQQEPNRKGNTRGGGDKEAKTIDDAWAATAAAAKARRNR